MAKTVIGLFDRIQQAQSAMDELIREGVSRDNLSLVMSEETGRKGGGPSGGGRSGESAGEGAASGAGVGAATGAVVGGTAGLLAGLGAFAIPGFGPLLAAGPIVALLTGAGVGAGVGAVAGGLIGALTNAGVPEEQAELYAESVKRGGTLLMIDAEDDMADEVADILDRHGAVDIEERATSLGMGRSAGMGAGQGQPQRQPQPQGRPPAGRKAETRPGEIRESVVEEQMRIGKREVAGGGVRVYTRITEQPVNEEVTLREEHVDVQRRPTDRPATREDLGRTGETVEIRETSEEPVIQKQARVVEEVVISKDVTERTQQVQDTLKRKDVEVERIPGQQAGTGSRQGMPVGGEQLEPEFRQHYQKEFTTGEHQYEQIAPAYQYGSQLRGDRRFQGRNWDEVRQEVRKDWEARNPGTFDRIEGAIRYGYDRSGMSGGGNR